ncbi:MAG: ATP-binding protein [Desulfamplus sp.]|nr:ATP-binding protein [Desulfamplus sp.]
MSDNDMFDVLETSEGITIIFSSTMDNVDRTCEEAVKFLMDSFKEFHCPEGIDCSKCLKSHLFSIQLVMREGLTNAVRHGNRFNVFKKVKCSVNISSDNLLRMEIEDQGEGFDWRGEQLRDRDADVDDTAEHGRGLLIMQQYFSRYWYNDSGNKLILEKQISFKQ